MFRDKKRIHFIYLLIDIFLIGFCFYLSYRLKLNFTLINPQSLSPLQNYRPLFIFWGVILILFLNNYRLYFTDRSLTIPLEILQVSKAVFVSSIVLAVVIFGLKIAFMSRFIFIVASLSLLVTLSFWRAVKRILVRHWITQGYYNFNVLIIGAGKTALELVDEIEENPYLGLKVVGFLDDYKVDNIKDYKILGKIQDLEKIVRRNFVDEIYLTIHSQRKLVSEVISRGIKLRRTVRVLADNFEIPTYQVKINYVGLLPLISYYEQGMHGTDRAIKRIFDIAVSLAALIIAIPLLLIIAFLIKMDSPGSVFYVSQRAGRKSKLFNFYKFRSMYVGADKEKVNLLSRSEVKGPIFKIKKDPRITRIGKILRRYSLDELPQLINVLKGGMSLVGPRPLPMEELSKCEEWQLRRLEVKPGIACLAQVRGRSDLSFYKWSKWDLWYIDNWSFGLDLRILLWIIPAVLKRKGAY